MKSFNWKRAGFVFALVQIALLAAGCNVPAWIATAQSILPIAGQIAAAVLALVAGFSGSPDAGAISTLANVISAAQKSFADVSAMIAEYQHNPSTTLLGDIENGIQAVIDSVAALLADTGIGNAALRQKVTAILTLLLDEVKSLGSVLPLLKAPAGAKFEVTVPMSSKEFRQAYDLIVSTPSGDPAVDLALTRLPRL